MRDCAKAREFFLHFEVGRAEKAGHGSLVFVSVKELVLETQLLDVAVALWVW